MIHRYDYLEDPTKHTEVKIAIRKIDRRLGTRLKQAQPKNRRVLDRMLHVCGGDLHSARNRMVLLLAYTTVRRRSELTSPLLEDLTLCGDGESLVLLRQLKSAQTREGLLFALDIETTHAVTKWIDPVEISDGYLLRGITGKRLNLAMDPGQISRVFKSLAIKARLDPTQISGHSEGIGQIMAKVGWSKGDSVMRYVGVEDITALNSVAHSADLTHLRAVIVGNRTVL